MPVGPGQTLSHYQLVKIIGAGGMGEVWKARDSKLKRYVAIKVLPHELTADPERRRRFLREARAAAAVNHPYVGTIYEAGEADGTTFIAMELIEGQTLRALLREGARPVHDAIRLAAEMAEGLAHAHEAGVIHRDLKPENVIVRPDQHPKILDFGLSKLLERSEPLRHSPGSMAETITGAMTREGTIFGTPAYMSPEQARGETVDSRSDIFSLGIVMYEMVTGRDPFHGKTPMDTLAAIINQQADAASQLNADVTPELDRILARCLEKNPADRYQHTGELLADLRKLRQMDEGSGIPAVPTTRLWSRSWPYFLAAGLVVIAASGYVRLRPLPVPDHPDSGRAMIAVLPFEDLGNDDGGDFLSEGLTEEMILTLGRLQPEELGVIGRISAMRYKNTDLDVRTIGEELGVDFVIEGTVRRLGNRLRIGVKLIAATDRTQLWGDSYDRSLGDMFQIQSDISQSVANALALELLPNQSIAAPTLDMMAHEQYLRGRYHLNRRSAADLLRSAEYYQEAVRLDSGYARAYLGLAEAYLMQGEYGLLDPQDAMQRVSEHATRALNLDPDLGEAHAALALATFIFERDWEAAEREFQVALKKAPGYASAHQWYGELLNARGEFDRALSQVEQAIAMDPLAPILSSMKAFMLLCSGRYEEAIEAADAALILESNFLPAWIYRGVAMIELSRTKQALDDLQAGLSSELQNDLGLYEADLKARLGDRDAALRRIEETSQPLDEDAWYQADRAFERAILHVALNDTEAALTALLNACEAGSIRVLSANVLPTWKEVRKLTRFPRLLECINYPEG